MNGRSGSLNQGRSLRRLVTFAVIAMLLLLFVGISFWGLMHSAWWYGGSERLADDQWDQITNLRDRLVQMGGPPAAIQALDHLLLLPQATPEDALYHLIKAAQTLTQTDQDPALRQVHAELRALVVEIQQDYGLFATPRVTPTTRPPPTLTPIIGAPVARSRPTFNINNCIKKGSLCP